MNPFNPWLLLGALVAALAIAAGGYAKGRVDGAAACDRHIDGLKESSQAGKDAEAAKGHQASADYEKGKQNGEIVYRDREKIVDRIIERPVYRNLCLDADGLREANSALTGSAAAAGEPGEPLPKADAAH